LVDAAFTPLKAAPGVSRMTFMTVSPDEFAQKIDVLAVTAATTAGGMLTFVLGEQLCCANCGHISTRWQVPAVEPASQQREDCDGRPDPGE
jgi:hypothetical protein